MNLASQPPLPFEAACQYQDKVLEWATDFPPNLPCETDVAYGMDGHQKCDIYYPIQAEGAPVVIFWHGGGWTNGYKEYCRFMAAHVTALGAVFVAPGYRLAPAVRFPGALDDCLAVIDYLADKSDFCGDLNNLHLSGHSAGGHLAAMIALGYRADEDRNCTIRSCTPISGIMELGNDAPAGTLDARVYEMVLSDRDDDVVYSPICWTKGNEIPFLLRYGERDSARVMRSNRRLYALLSRQSGLCRCEEEAGKDHFSTHLSLRSADAGWYRDLAGLLKGAQ